MYDNSAGNLFSVSLGELRYGAEKSQPPKKAPAAIEQLTNAIQVMPIDNAVAQQYGKIRARLEQAGQMIGNNDLWIAAHAKTEGWSLVTNNEREFKRVAGLKIENWAKPCPLRLFFRTFHLLCQYAVWPIDTPRTCL